MSRPLLVYTILRLLVFLGALGVLALVGMSGFPALLTALLVSSLASVFVLRRQRDAVSAQALVRREQRVADRARRQDRLRQDDERQDDVRRDDARQDDVRQDDVRQDGAAGSP